MSNLSSTVTVVIVAVLALAACTRNPRFECASDDQCTTGRCEPGGACSHYDPTCPLGYRHGDSAGDLAGQCVVGPLETFVDAMVDADDPAAVDGSPPDAAADAGSTGPTGSRNECAEGLAMPAATSACVADVCTRSPACCRVAWDEACVQLVEATCRRSCSQVSFTTYREDGLHGRRMPRIDQPDYVVFDKLDIHTQTPLPGRVHEVAVADYDSDGRPDIALSGPYGWHVLHNESVGATLVMRQVASHLVPSPELDPENDGHGGHHIAWADWDHDGDLDLSVAHLEGNLHLIRHDPGAAQPFVQVEPAFVTGTVHGFDWGDVTGDDVVDLVVAFDRVGTVYVNDGHGVLSASPWVGDAQFGIRLCDLTDGPLPEIITTDYPGNLLVYRNNGTPEGTPSFTVPRDHGTNYGEIDCGDVDGDGDLDVAVGSQTDQKLVSVFRNPGQRGGLESTAAWSLPAASATYSQDFGDMNGDGKLDLAIAHQGEVRWLENMTTSTSAIRFDVHGPYEHLSQVGLDLGPELAGR